MGRDRRADLLLAAGISPCDDLSPRAEAAVSTLLDLPSPVVEAVLAMWALVDEARPPVQHRPVTRPPEGLEYPNPRSKARKPSGDF